MPIKFPGGSPSRFILLLLILLNMGCDCVFGRGVFRSPDSSCAGRCTVLGSMEEWLCQCDPACVFHGDCCPDYDQACRSCAGRCDIGYDPRLPCQCHWSCEIMGPCCADYLNNAGCGLAMANSVSDRDLYALSEKLWRIDLSVSPVFLNLTHAADLTTYESVGQLFQEPIDEEILSRPTISAMQRLFDNYHPLVTDPEKLVSTQVAEIESFIETVLGTQIFGAVEEFLQKSRLATSRPHIKELLMHLWFGLYCRSDGPQCTRGSSGFEHVFMFEQLNSKELMGFHNWIFYFLQELSAEISLQKLLRIQELVPHQRYLVEAELVSANGAKKPITSILVGASPEFELAMYTVCFFARPNADCPFSVAQGWKSTIKTFGQPQGADTFVGTAYFTIPPVY